MKVLISAESLAAPLTGIGNYTLQLATGLREHRDVDQVRLFGSHRWLDDENTRPASIRPAVSRYRLPFKSYLRKIHAYTRSTNFYLRTTRLKGFLYHCPNFIPLPFDGTTITSIHDLSFIKFPDCHPQERVDWLTRNIGKSIEKSAHIITDSVYVRDEVIELLGANPDKVSSVPLGVAGRFRPYSEESRKPVLHRYRLNDRGYLLCVSTLEPRKNLLRLLAAYESLPGSLKQRYALVLVGTRGWLVDDLANKVSRLQETDNVRWLDYVPSEDLPAIYSGARAFIFPSLYEGFGLPILEAMACGTPVLCSSHPSVREVGGNAVYLMDELDDVSIRSGMERLLQDETLCAQLVQSGLERAGAFTWERCIDRTVNIYQSLSDRH